VNQDQLSLQAGFAQFVAAARELEASYAALKARAHAVDVELQASNQRLQQALLERDAVFAALPIGLVASRADGSIASSNPEAQRLLAAACAAGVDLAKAPDGDQHFGVMSVRLRRLALPDGALLLLEDRSQVQELAATVSRLDRLAGLSELAFGIAHEIKNPLNGVMGFAALLRRSEDPVAMRRFAGKVVEGVQQVDEIVKALLGFARPERQRGRLAAIAEIVRDAAAAASLPTVRLQIAGQAHLRADADALLRVLSNLFRNALEAAPAARITVQVGTGRGRLEILVQDDGPGIPAGIGQRVFEPFVSSKERGTGLGLPLCLRVLSFLGGNLELLNPGEPGARFRIRLPLAELPANAADGAA
jgi:signal transduction histidine kinase